MIFNLEETKDFDKSSFFVNAYLEDHYEKENSCISAELFSFPGRQQCSARPFFALNGMDISEMVMKCVGSTGAVCFLLVKHPRLHFHAEVAELPLVCIFALKSCHRKCLDNCKFCISAL